MSHTLFSPENLYIIRWRDAVSSSQRIQASEAQFVDLVVNTNVGWIFDENEKRTVLVHGYSETGELDYFAIPASCIVEKIPVMQKRRRKNRESEALPGPQSNS